MRVMLRHVLLTSYCAIDILLRNAWQSLHRKRLKSLAAFREV